MSLSGKFDIPSGNCQGNVSEFCFRLSMATLEQHYCEVEVYEVLLLKTTGDLFSEQRLVS